MSEKEEFLELARGVRRVRTPAGAKKYGQPIGTIITLDMIRDVNLRESRDSSSGSRRSNNVPSPKSPKGEGTAGRPPVDENSAPRVRQTSPSSGGSSSAGNSSSPRTTQAPRQRTNPLEGRAQLTEFRGEGPNRFQVGGSVYSTTRGTKVYRMPGKDNQVFLQDPNDDTRVRLITERGEIKPSSPEGQRIINGMFTRNRDKFEVEDTVEAKQFKRRDSDKDSSDNNRSDKSASTDNSDKSASTDTSSESNNDTSNEGSSSSSSSSEPKESSGNSSESENDSPSNDSSDNEDDSSSVEEGVDPGNEYSDTVPETGEPRPEYDETADQVQNQTGVRVGDRPNADWLLVSRNNASLEVDSDGQTTTWHKDDVDSWYPDTDTRIRVSDQQMDEMLHREDVEGVRVTSHGDSEEETDIDYDGASVRLADARRAVRELETSSRMAPWTILKGNSDSSVTKSYRSILPKAKERYPEMRPKSAVIAYLRDNDNFSPYVPNDTDNKPASRSQKDITPERRDSDSPTIRLGGERNRKTPQGNTSGEFTEEEIDGAINLLEGYTGRQMKSALRKEGNPLADLNHHELVGFERDKDVSRKKFIDYLKNEKKKFGKNNESSDTESKDRNSSEPDGREEVASNESTSSDKNSSEEEEPKEKKAYKKGDTVTGDDIRDMPSGSRFSYRAGGTRVELVRQDDGTITTVRGNRSYLPSHFRNSQLSVVSVPENDETPELEDWQKRILRDAPGYDFNGPGYSSTEGFVPRFQGEIPPSEARAGDLVTMSRRDAVKLFPGADSYPTTVSGRIAHTEFNHNGSLRGYWIAPGNDSTFRNEPVFVSATSGDFNRLTYTSARGSSPVGRGHMIDAAGYPETTGTPGDLQAGDYVRGHSQIVGITNGGRTLQLSTRGRRHTVNRDSLADQSGNVTYVRPIQGDPRQSDHFRPVLEYDRSGTERVNENKRDGAFDSTIYPELDRQVGSSLAEGRTVDVGGISIPVNDVAELSSYLRNSKSFDNISGNQMNDNLPARFRGNDWSSALRDHNDSGSIARALSEALRGDRSGASELDYSSSRDSRFGSTPNASRDIMDSPGEVFNVDGQSFVSGNGNIWSYDRDNNSFTRVDSLPGDSAGTTGQNVLRYDNFESDDVILDRSQFDNLPIGTKVTSNDGRSLRFTGSGRFMDDSGNEISGADSSIYPLRVNELGENDSKRAFGQRFTSYDNGAIAYVPGGDSYTYSNGEWVGPRGRLTPDQMAEMSSSNDFRVIPDYALAPGARSVVNTPDEMRRYPAGTVFKFSGRNEEYVWIPRLGGLYQRNSTLKKDKNARGEDERERTRINIEDTFRSNQGMAAIATVPPARENNPESVANELREASSLKRALDRLGELFPDLDTTGVNSRRDLDTPAKRKKFQRSVAMAGFMMESYPDILGGGFMMYTTPHRDGNRGMLASYSERSVRYNPSSFEDRDYLRTNDGWFRTEGIPDDITDMEYITHHELGHGMDREFGWRLGPIAQRTFAEHTRGMSPGEASALSGKYATTNEAEMWTELFSQWSLSETPSPLAVEAVKNAEDYIRTLPGREDFKFIRYVDTERK